VHVVLHVPRTVRAQCQPRQHGTVCLLVNTGLTLVGKSRDWVEGLTYDEINERANTGPVKQRCEENKEGDWSDEDVFYQDGITCAPARYGATLDAMPAHTPPPTAHCELERGTCACVVLFDHVLCNFANIHLEL
jgi:hypothetical protein